ncbi:MAG: hypothetical protein V4787_24630 [Pseudomonadota bacterium]
MAETGRMLAQGTVCRSESSVATATRNCVELKVAREVQVIGQTNLAYWVRVRFLDSGDEELMLKGAVFPYDESKIKSTKRLLFAKRGALRCVDVNDLSFDRSGPLPKYCSRVAYEEAVSGAGDAPTPGWTRVREYASGGSFTTYYAKEDLIERTVYEKIDERRGPPAYYCTTLLDTCSQKETPALRLSCRNAATRMGCN